MPADVFEPDNVREPDDGQAKYAQRLVRQRNVWMITTWVLVGLLIAAIVVVFLPKKPDKEASGGTVVLTEKQCENLASRVDGWQSGEGEGAFSASVETFGGLEYLVLTSGEGDEALSLYYRNESYLDEAQKTPTDMGLLLSNGEKTVELLVPYDLNDEWEHLCPERITLNGRDCILFRVYEKDRVAELAIVDVETMYEYEARAFDELVREWFSVKVGKQLDTIVLTTGNGSSYEYEATPELVKAVDRDGAGVLQSDKHFTWEVAENGIEFCAAIYSDMADGDEAYYGELRGSIVPKDGRLVAESSLYGAYVDPDFDDEEGDKINAPFAEYLKEPIVLTAGTGERLYLKRYEKVSQHEYDWSGLTKADGDHRYLKDADGNVISKLGIDVSKHQGDIDWAKVAEAGVEFAFIRVGYRGSREGSLYIDEYKDANIQGALENGIPVGVYFYSQAITVEEAIEEAELVLSAIEGYDIALPVVFDTEYYEAENARGNATSRVDRTAIAKAFCERIAADKYQPMVYASTRWSIMNIDRDELAGYPFWFAYYGDTVSYRYDFQIWQYSASGKVSGVNGNCDMNLWLGDWPLEDRPLAE